jgi:hypothetical protein
MKELAAVGLEAGCCMMVGETVFLPRRWSWRWLPDLSGTEDCTTLRHFALPAAARRHLRRAGSARRVLEVPAASREPCASSPPARPAAPPTSSPAGHRPIARSANRDRRQQAGAAGAIAVGELLQAPARRAHAARRRQLAGQRDSAHRQAEDRHGESLKPIAELARGGLVLVGNPSFPAKTLPELVAYAKANPGKVSYASYSPGTLSHVLGLLSTRRRASTCCTSATRAARPRSPT